MFSFILKWSFFFFIGLVHITPTLGLDHEDSRGLLASRDKGSTSLKRNREVKEESEEEESEEKETGKRQRRDRVHYFGLLEGDKSKGTCYESRAQFQALMMGEFSFKEWHEQAIRTLKELTPQVRKVLTWPGRQPAKKNVLKYRVDLFLNDNRQIEIENPDVVWVSGWPMPNAQAKLRSELKDINFRFIASFVPGFEALSDDEKNKYLIEATSRGYCLTSEKYSFLIQQRLDHQRQSLERARKEVSHLNQRYLHTEQGLLLYLSSIPFLERLVKVIEDNKIGKNEVLTLVVNVASSQGLCMNCSDRFFRESEWGETFLYPLENSLRGRHYTGRLKLHFVASAYEAYPDDLRESPGLASFYSATSAEERKRLGFHHSSPKIEFLSNLGERQPFNETMPFIGHAYMPDI